MPAVLVCIIQYTIILHVECHCLKYINLQCKTRHIKPYTIMYVVVLAHLRI